jgi:hypothetical protein
VKLQGRVKYGSQFDILDTSAIQLSWILDARPVPIVLVCKGLARDTLRRFYYIIIDR